MADTNVNKKLTKAEKRARSLIRSSGSSLVVCLIGIFIPFLAALSVLIGIGYGIEAKKLSAEASGLELSIRTDLRRAAKRYRMTAIVGGLITMSWVLVVLVIVVTMD